MTLDEAIKHAEEVANIEAKKAEWFDLGDDSSEMFRENYVKRKKCAEEHHQLAEWLKELKHLKERESCEMTAEEYRQRMIQAFHNADCDELIALVVLPTEKEFEHLGWLLEKHYKAKPEPCEDEYIKVPKKALKYRTAGMVAYNAEWLKNHFNTERAVICGAQEPCVGAISRQAAIDALGGNHGL